MYRSLASGRVLKLRTIFYSSKRYKTSLPKLTAVLNCQKEIWLHSRFWKWEFFSLHSTHPFWTKIKQHLEKFWSLQLHYNVKRVSEKKKNLKLYLWRWNIIFLKTLNEILTTSNSNRGWINNEKRYLITCLNYQGIFVFSL